MRGVEKLRDGTTRFYYQYKPNGPKYYYQKTHCPRTLAQKPKGPKPKPYEPPPRQTPMQAQFALMHPNVQRLINLWLLVFGFRDVDDVNGPEVNRAFRQLSLKHHPDRGGSEEKYKELTSVRDHLLTLVAMADTMR